MENEVSETTKLIVKAVNGNWGYYATRKFLEKRGIDPRLYYLARTLNAGNKTLSESWRKIL